MTSSLKSPAVVLAIAALLAGCGGGSDTAATAEASPAAAAATMRARIQSAAPTASAQAVAAAATVSPEEAARQLMNYGEANFPDLFPEHQTTLTFGAFRYRLYSNGLYLGVVVSDADPAYQMGGVYVMGKQFGVLPLYVAPLTSYITPTPTTDPDPSGAGNGCHDLALSDTEGTHAVIAYEYRGPTSGTVTVDMLTGAMTTFEGQQARVLTSKTTGNTTTAGQTVALNIESKSYLRRTAESELTHYGSLLTTTNTVGALTTTTSTKVVYTPPWLDRQYALPLGDSLTTTQIGATTITTSTTGLPPTTNTGTVNTDLTLKYAGRETLAVPAGTFNTCKFESTNSGGVAATTQWVIVGKGLPVKTVTVSGSTTQSSEATSVTLNGQKL